MSQLGTVYATKRRRRNGKSLKPPPKDGVTKSNPSKRHRERLNAELDLLASLLPFEQNILSKLDRLSILRLSVSYLRTKSYFQVVMHKEKEENGLLSSHINPHDSYRNRELGAFEHNLLEGDMFLQALNGFLMILTCEGEVFFATHSIESYLGFHQSDIVHQSVYELVHSEDREELQRQLLWNSLLPSDLSGMSLAEALAPDKITNLERSFTVRFRCLLDNTSGFLRLDIRGRIKILHGQNRKTEEPPLALFAFCTPFGPPSLLEIPQKENMFKSKHKLDLSLVSMDQRGKLALGYSDTELVNMGGYDLVHYDDLGYVASAHQELLKTGASGMIAYRYQKKDGEWQWLQTSSRLVYKNSKPDFVICTHRQLMDEEGRDLLGKRTMDFKVSYLDTGLASTYFTEADQLIVPSTNSPNNLPPPPPVTTPQRPNRRYKTQLRDFLSTCRSKRKLQQQSSPLGQITPPAAAPSIVEYIPDPAAAVAAAYSNLNPMYTTSPYANTTTDNLYITPSVHSSNFYPVSTENLFHQYRLQGVSSYYPDYHHTTAPTPYVTNGFLSYESYSVKDDKWPEPPNKYYSNYSSGYGSPTSTSQIPIKTPKSSPHIMEIVSCSSDGPSPVSSTPNHIGTGTNNNNPSNISQSGGGGGGGRGSSTPTTTITPKIENSPPEHFERQTVLMWGPAGENNTNTAIPISVVNSTSSRSPPINTPTTNGGNNAVIYNNENHTQHKLDDSQQSTQQQQETNHLKWNGNNSTNNSKEIIVSNDVSSMYQLQHQHSNESVDSGSASLYGHHHSHSHQINQTHHNGTGTASTGGGEITTQHQHQTVAHSNSRADVIMQSVATNSNSQNNNNNNNVSNHMQHHSSSGGHGPSQHRQHHHSGGHHGHQAVHHHHHHHAHSSPLGSATSCEVWSPASYSQYSQYLSYHHASQHASTQSSLTEITPSDPYHTPHISSSSSNRGIITSSSSTTTNNSNTSMDSHHRLARHNHPNHHHLHRSPPSHHLPQSSVPLSPVQLSQPHQQQQQSAQSQATSLISTQLSSHPVPIEHHQIPLIPPSTLHHHHHHPHHHHHAYHHQHATSVGGNISPISPLTQLSHTHHRQMRTPITRTGVLCCPSLR